MSSAGKKSWTPTTHGKRAHCIWQMKMCSRRYRYCPTCKEFKEATKQVDLWSAPDVLVIHLKRFSAGRFGRDKISDLVDFPLEGLDLSDRTVYRKLADKLVTTPEGREVLGTDQVNQENMIYDLFAVDNHFGGLGGVCLLSLSLFASHLFVGSLHCLCEKRRRQSLVQL